MPENKKVISLDNLSLFKDEYDLQVNEIVEDKADTYELTLTFDGEDSYMSQEDIDYIREHTPTYIKVHLSVQGYERTEIYALVGWTRDNQGSDSKLTYQSIMVESNVAHTIYALIPATASDPVIGVEKDYASFSDLSQKQDTLVSGTNIKSINNESILGAGNLDLCNYAEFTPSNVDITMDPFGIEIELSQADREDISQHKYKMIRILTANWLTVNMTLYLQTDAFIQEQYNIVGYLGLIDVEGVVYYYSMSIINGNMGECVTSKISNDVVANPTLVGSEEALSSLEVAGTKYKVEAGLSNDIKDALLACFEHVAWTNNSGQLYYDTLYNLLYPPVPLLSISAVYTQSDVVYDTQALDSLKADLVVTGHYEDGSSRQIDPALCTLSGTLVEGTSTITVTFDSKSTTFTVQVTHSDIPAEYESYDYITYTSTSGNYGRIGDNMIITDEFADMNKIKVDTYFRPKTTTTQATGVMGGRESGSATSNDKFWVIFCKTSTGRVSSFCHGVAVAVDDNAQISNLQLAHVITDPGTQSPASIQVNSDSNTTAWENTGITNTAKIAFCGYLGNDYTSSTWQQMQNFAEVGRTKFYDVTTDTLVGDYVPCLRKADNVIGMFDIVNQTFHTTATAAKATRNGGSTNWDIGNW